MLLPRTPKANGKRWFIISALKRALGLRQRFQLLDLPMELLLRILMSAVVDSSIKDPIVIDHPKQLRGKGNGLLQPPITRTYRLLRNEGLPIFYSKNVFNLSHYGSDDTTLSRWLSSLHDTQKSELTIWCDMDMMSSAGPRSYVAATFKVLLTFDLGQVQDIKVDFNEDTEKTLVRRIGDRIYSLCSKRRRASRCSPSTTHGI